MNPKPTNVNEYLASLSPPERKALGHIRSIVKQLAPEVEESIAYGLPTFKYKGKPLIYFGAFKDHLSVFPTSAPIAALKDKLKEFEQAKGTLHFTLEKPIPDELLKEIIITRMRGIDS